SATTLTHPPRRRNSGTVPDAIPTPPDDPAAALGTAPEETGATCAEPDDGIAGAAACDDGRAAAPEPEAATAVIAGDRSMAGMAALFPDSISRFTRFRSARRS